MFKYKLQKAVEILTGRNCKNCKYNMGIFCEHPEKAKGKRCRDRIFPVGYERRDPTDEKCKNSDHTGNG